MTPPGSPLDDPRPMGRIPFYPDERRTWQRQGLDLVEPLEADPGCRRCALGPLSARPCMPSVPILPEVNRLLPVTLLVLPAPTQRDDAAGEWVPSGAAQDAVWLARQHARGDVRLTWAVRCGAGQPEEASVAACRPYLAGEFARAGRVVVFGPLAAASVLGHALDARRFRRAWGWVRNRPCYVVGYPGFAQRNRVWKRQLREDVAWAMTSPEGARPDGVVEVLGTAERAAEWLGRVGEEPIAVDTEYSPKNYWAPGEFKLLCVSLAVDPQRPVVIPGVVLALPEVREAFRRVMEDWRVPKVNHWIKGDVHVLRRALGVEVQGIEWDTGVFAGLLHAEEPATLAAQQFRVGFGGAKQAIEEDDE
jgi:uracil-DNA glycosylase